MTKMQKPPTQFFVYNLHTSTENLFYCWNYRPFRYVIRVDQFYFNTQMVSRNSATLPTKVCINRVWLVLHFVLTFYEKKYCFSYILYWHMKGKPLSSQLQKATYIMITQWLTTATIGEILHIICFWKTFEK